MAETSTDTGEIVANVVKQKQQQLILHFTEWDMREQKNIYLSIRPISVIKRTNGNNIDNNLNKCFKKGHKARIKNEMRQCADMAHTHTRVEKIKQRNDKFVVNSTKKRNGAAKRSFGKSFNNKREKWCRIAQQQRSASTETSHTRNSTSKDREEESCVHWKLHIRVMEKGFRHHGLFVELVRIHLLECMK